ncbi:MAG: MBL fold metallo-hydrolase [Acidobacteriota bacterium]
MKRLRSALASLAIVATVAAPLSAQLGAPPLEVFEPDALRVFVCGSASPLGNVPDRAQACLAVIAGPQMFLVDIGAGGARNLGRSRLPMNRLSAVLITHYHSDHIADLPGVNLNSWVAGRSGPLEVIGPEGVDRVVAGFNEAYALDRSYRTAHHGEELLPAAVGPMTARTINEGVIHEEGGLKITAFEVEHPPIKPAYGYRFDYLGRSVVISGDTIPTASLEKASNGVDLLLHDAMSLRVTRQIGRMLGAAGNRRLSQIVEDVQDYHATTTDLVELADRAEVGTLAFYHLVPAPPTEGMLQQFMDGMPEDVIVVRDGLLFELAGDADTTTQRTLF